MLNDRSPLLTERQWEAFIDPDSMRDSDKWTNRSKAKARVRDIIKDFTKLMMHLPADDRRDIMKGVRTGTDKFDDGDRLRIGVTSLLAFLYQGVDDRPEFEHLLEEAVLKARSDRQRIPVNVSVEIDIVRDVDREEVVQRYKDGEDLTIGEVTAALSASPKAEFMGFAPDSPWFDQEEDDAE